MFTFVAKDDKELTLKVNDPRIPNIEIVLSEFGLLDDPTEGGDNMTVNLSYDETLVEDEEQFKKIVGEGLNKLVEEGLRAMLGREIAPK